MNAPVAAPDLVEQFASDQTRVILSLGAWHWIKDKASESRVTRARFSGPSPRRRYPRRHPKRWRGLRD